MKAKNLLVSMLLVIGIIGCAWVGITPRPSDFCGNIPPDSYSVICEITDQLGTTPEVIGAGIKIGVIAGVDQWVTAEDLDKMFVDIIDQVHEYRSYGTVSWSQFAQYVLGRYKLLPQKAQDILNVSSEFFNFDVSTLPHKVPSNYDWDRVEMRMESLRLTVLPYKKKPKPDSKAG